MEIPGLRDYAVVYVNGEKVGVLNRYYKNYSLEVDILFNSTLEILVENMGRINYGPEIVRNTKGIISPVKINGFEIEDNWNMFKLPMNDMPDFSKMSADVYSNISEKVKVLSGKPVFYEGSFQLSETGDTFLDMESWGKGIVFINGINIGRYWQVGPQQTLYIPGVWLRKGENKIVVFEQLNEELKTEIRTTTTPILNHLKQKSNEELLH